MTNLRDIARTIFDRSLADCSVEQAVARHLSVRGKTLHVGEETIDLGEIQRVRVVAAGKAARPMLIALLQQRTLPPHCDLAGVLIAPEGSPSLPSQLPKGFQVFAGGHPSPNQASFAGARAALAMLKELPQDAPEKTLCFFLISGGASAMMELPLDPSISLADTVNFHRALVGSGASIAEINCVRKHFSAVKGGRLAMAAGNAICRSLLVSDVPAGCEDALGSGPTVPDFSTVAECKEILERYRLLARFPATVRRFFTSEALVETPKPEALHAQASVLLSAQALAEAAAKNAEAQGYLAVIDNSCDEWEYKAAAHYLLDRLQNLRLHHPNLCLISAGEVSVSLPATSDNDATVGVGGRNLQFALYAATLLRSEDDPIAILSAGSDGIDGNSPAAGAVVDRATLAGCNPGTIARALERFDACPFLVDRKAAIVIGPSGNNLRDLRILIAGNPQASTVATVGPEIP
ncbi:MAG: glycerate kinase type-2 family protein [Acidobacteriaceae bacterium]